MRAGARLVIAVAVTACGKGDDGGEPKRMSTATPPPPPAAHPVDAGVAAPPAPAPAGKPGSDEELWLDPTPGGDRTARPAADRRRPARPARFVQLTLRSSPPGATVYIDGERVGVTPTFWEGEVDARPRDFTFTLPGYVTMRYRFVPVTSGTVHPRLEKLMAPQPDAGVDTPPPT